MRLPVAIGTGKGFAVNVRASLVHFFALCILNLPHSTVLFRIYRLNNNSGVDVAWAFAQATSTPLLPQTSLLAGMNRVLVFE